MPSFEEIPLVFLFRFSFWRGKTQRKSKGKKKGNEQREHSLTRLRNQGSDRWYPRRTWSCAWCVSYVRSWWNGSRCFYLPSRAPNGTDRRKTNGRSSQDVVRVPPCCGSERDRLVSPFLSLPFLRTKEGGGFRLGILRIGGAFLGTHRNQSTTDATNEGTKGQ